MMDTQQDNQNNEINPDTNSNPEVQISVGQTLRAAREEMGLSVNDVANRIKFAPKQIESLEDDDYARLPEAAFVRGFVRSYARLLEIDSALLLSGLPTSHLKTSSVQEVKSVEIPMPTELSARRHNIILLAVGLVIALAVAIFERMNDSVPKVAEPVTSAAVQSLELPDVAAGGASAPVAVQDQVQIPAPQQVVRAVPVPPTQQLATTQPARVAPVATQAPQPAAPKTVRVEPATGLQPSAAPVSAAPPKLDGYANAAVHALRLEFEEEAWVEVKDSSDKILMSRMHRAGSLVRVSGTAPLMVTIGNARAVRLFDNGKQISLERYTTADVARVTLK